MFRNVIEARNAVPDSGSRRWEGGIRPHLIETSLEPSDFNNDLVETIESLDRDITMYGLGETRHIPGIGDECYEMVFDSRMHGGDEPRPMTYFVGTRNGDATSTAIPLPDSGAMEKQLRKLEETEDGLRGVSDGLVERIQAFDSTRVNDQNTGQHEMKHLYKCLEPEEIEKLEENHERFSVISQDAYNAQQYFTHMASLISTGYFADNESLRFAVGLHGLRRNGKHSVFHDFQRSGRDTAARDDERPGLKDCSEEIRRTLSEPWYESDDLERNLKWPDLLRQMDSIGQAWRHAAEIGASATRLAKDPVEGIISELYGAFTGEQPTRHENFVDRIDTIAQTADAQESLNPLRDLYYAEEGKIGVSDIRNGGTHASTQLFENYTRKHDHWAALFYQSLAKTALTTLTDKPQAYFEHDAYARENRMMRGDNPVVTVDLDIAKHHESGSIGYENLEMA